MADPESSTPSPLVGEEPALSLPKGWDEGEPGHLLDNLLLFGRLLRRLGLDVHTGRMLDAISVLEDIGVRRKADVRAALRTLLVHRRDDLPLFDEAFDVFWRQRKDRMSSMDLRSMGEQRRYRRVEAGPPPTRTGTGRSWVRGRRPHGAARPHRPDPHLQRAGSASGEGLRGVHTRRDPASQAVSGIAAVGPGNATH